MCVILTVDMDIALTIGDPCDAIKYILCHLSVGEQLPLFTTSFTTITHVY